MYNLDDIKDYPEVRLEDIIKVVSPYQIFSFYLGKDITLGEVMLSPLRKVDKRPSFSVFRSRNGKILYHDFGTGESGDWVDFVGRMFGLGFYDSLVRIVIDFNLKFSYSQNTKPAPYKGFVSKLKDHEIKTKELIRIKIRKFSSGDFTYWNKYGISEKMLAYYKVVAVQSVFYGDIIIAQSGFNDPIFAYLFHKDGSTTYKVYRPLAKNGRKWYNTANKSVLQGWDQMPPKGDLLIITKSLKDVMVLRSLGFIGLAMQSEMSFIKQSVMDELLGRFTTIFILQDFDLAGVSGVNRMRKKFTTLKYFFIQTFATRHDGMKDISDYREKHGPEKTKELLNKFIHGTR